MTIITVDGRLADVALPLPIEKLRGIVSSDVGSFRQEEEAKLAAWLSTISVSTLPCPLEDERWEEIASGARTSATEDRKLSGWAIAIWDAIQAHLR